MAQHKALLLAVLANLSEVGPSCLDSKTHSTWLLRAHFYLSEPGKMGIFRGPVNFFKQEDTAREAGDRMIRMRVRRQISLICLGVREAGIQNRSGSKVEPGHSRSELNFARWARLDGRGRHSILKDKQWQKRRAREVVPVT